MNKNWKIDPGVIEHTSRPCFKAQWATGQESLEHIEGPCWRFEASGSEDSIHIFTFAWHDPPPSQADFEKLMDEAATAIDSWISTRF